MLTPNLARIEGGDALAGEVDQPRRRRPPRRLPRSRCPARRRARRSGSSRRSAGRCASARDCGSSQSRPSASPAMPAMFVLGRPSCWPSHDTLPDASSIRPRPRRVPSHSRPCAILVQRRHEAVRRERIARRLDDASDCTAATSERRRSTRHAALRRRRCRSRAGRRPTIESADTDPAIGQRQLLDAPPDRARSGRIDAEHVFAGGDPSAARAAADRGDRTARRAHAACSAGSSATSRPERASSATRPRGRADEHASVPPAERHEPSL